MTTTVYNELKIEDAPLDILSEVREAKAEAEAEPKPATTISGEIVRAFQARAGPDDVDLQPAMAWPPLAPAETAALGPRDMLSFISASIDQDGLVGHNLHGYNELIKHGINRIMTELFDINRPVRNERQQTENDRKRKSFQVRFQFHDVQVGRPTCTTYLTGQFTDLYPASALLTGLPYSGAVTLGATASIHAHYEDGRTEEKIAEIPPFQIGGFPIMARSAGCHTSNCTREGLKQMGEDPTDPGGYFIAKRGEWTVDLLEQIRYNSVHLHRAMKANEHVRAEFLSQPNGAFENSSQIRLRFMTNGQLTVEINSMKFEKVRLPFFLIYRLFGMTDDRMITETIVFDADDRAPVTTRMLDILERAFQLADKDFAPLIPELNREKLVQMTAERIAKYLTNPAAYLTNESAVQFLNEDLLGSPSKPGGLDKVLLPHMGQTGEARIRKLRFLGLIIHKMLLVHLGVMPPTDRDSYRNKRVHGAGVSLAKAFKTQVNNSIVIPIFRALKRELKNNPWESITDKTLTDTFRNALTTSDLNRAMEQAITSGNKTIIVRRRAATNRVSSQALERKNGLNTLSALRTVVTQNAGNASKQTERADMMRRVHPTYIGFICVAQSADSGESVGMRKQLAIGASVCTAGEAYPLKLRLLGDPAITALDRVASADILRQGLARVFVNGEWIGMCADAYALASRYRALRREMRVVDPYTTIACDPLTSEVEFWLDIGRLRRPLLIVDSNVAAYDAALRARHAWAKKIGGAPVEGLVLEGADGAPVGIYFAAADRYFEFTERPGLPQSVVGDAVAAATAAIRAAGREPNAGDAASNAAASAAALERKRLSDLIGQFLVRPSLRAADALVAAGGAAVAAPPDEVRTAAAALISKYGAGGVDGAPARVEFEQNIRFTPAHVRAIANGQLRFSDLIAEGIAEYITPEEQENCLIARSIEALFECRHDITAQYSHCDIEQTIFGLAAHMSPFGNHTQPARVTYETNQGRQTGGWYVLNFPFRTDKNRFFQFYNEIPLVRTFIHKLVLANGSNVVIAYASYGGDNQEDSAITCQASADRGMFHGAFFRFELGELEKGESFCSPDALTTKNLKPNASYEKLVDGAIRPGCVARYGDVLIGRVAKLSRGRAGAAADDRYQFTDRSIVYRRTEPAFVEAVLRLRGADDQLFILVKLRFDRPLRTGDKLSSRSGNKSIVARMLPQSDMPFTEDGLTPDLIINTHCIAGETPITTYYGTARRMDSMPVDGGAVLYGWDGARGGFVRTRQAARMTRGEDDVVRVTLADGRALRCTADHPVYTVAPDGTVEQIEAGLLAPGVTRVLVGPEAPLDEVGADEAGWALQVTSVEPALGHTVTAGYHMSDERARESALAFARLAGLRHSMGAGSMHLGHPLDAAIVARDVALLSGVADAIDPHDACRVDLPAELDGQLTAIYRFGGGWPAFVRDLACPTAVLREFLGGLFGGGRHQPPCLITNEHRPAGAEELSGPAFELSGSAADRPTLYIRILELGGLLVRAGVVGATTRMLERKGEWWATLRAPQTSEFAERIGYRYCIQKSSRLTAATAYWRLRETHRGGPAPNARAFFEENGCLGWFVTNQRGHRTKTNYITAITEDFIAPFTLKVADVRKDGRAVTYDISVPGVTNFLAAGITVSNSQPTRMTVGQLIETKLSKVCARKGVIADGTAFLPVDHFAITAELLSLGFRHNGCERMYNGMTGEYFDAAIFIGPTTEQRLQKFVLDDEQSVAGSGPTDATTGQPLGGKNVKGGLRLGYMEKDTLDSHGAMINYAQKAQEDSDGRMAYVCRGCGDYAIYNEFREIYQCRTCGEMADIAAVDSSKSAILFRGELSAANIRMQLGLRPREYLEGPAA